MAIPVAITSLFQEPVTTIYDKAGTAETVYTGIAKSRQEPASLAVVSVSTAAAAVIASTAHGLASDNLVTIAGGAGDWAALNGNRIITVTGVDTFTVAVNSSAFTGSFAGTITTTSPRTSAGVWVISKSYVSGDISRTANANGSTAANQVWDNRASLSYQ